MEKTTIIWIMVIVALGVMVLPDISILRPFESSIYLVDESVDLTPLRDGVTVLSPGFAA
jgi:hypothetical protein